MELEKEIQQSSFKSQKHKAFLNILYTASWIGCQQQRMFKEYGVTPQQYNVLRILRGQKGKAISVNGIQERMLDRNSNASRLIDKLTEKKLCERLTCPNDRRQVDVLITPVGMELLGKMDVEIDRSESSFGNMTEEEAQTLNTILDKMRD